MCRRSSTLVLFVLLLTFIMPVAYAHERNDGGHYTIIDETGTVIDKTGWGVQIGDQLLTENNKRYEIVSIDGDTVRAKFLEEVNLAQYTPKINWYYGVVGFFQTPASAQKTGKVAIYHTHSDESYVPTDGKESILGAGGIYKVGEAFAQSLESKGLNVIFSKAKHDPHDNMAYERSRRTVAELLKQQPDAIFDVHRDAVPPEVYGTTIDGKEVSKVQLVVGKYGPTGKQIEEYALKIKAAADQQHKGLVKGIFFAKGGDYNQDLHPRSMLLEVGAHTNSRESAERGIALFADVVPVVLGQTSASPANTSGTTGAGTAASGPSGSTKSVGWIIGFLVVGAAAFLLISTGSLKEAGAKLKQFASTEFANFLGPKKRSKPDKGNKKPDNK